MPPIRSRNPRVLVFDSGVGGLSIARAIKELNHVDIIYVSDNAAFPYGTKSETTLIDRTKSVLKEIQQQVEADIIVIACNTASTVTLPTLRESFNEPVIGVVPAIKPAALVSKSKVIGLLATPGTVSRDYTHDLIRSFASDCRIVPLGCSELVYFAEEKLKGNDINIQQLIALIHVFKKNKTIDTVVLACTHFPLLLDELKIALPDITHWIDSGDAIARRVAYWISELNFETTNHEMRGQSFFTQHDTAIDNLHAALVQNQLDNIQFIELPFTENNV